VTAYRTALSDARFHARQLHRSLEQARELAPTASHHDSLGHAVELAGRIGGFAKHLEHLVARAQRREGRLG
jgi:hypothetical protein